MYDSVNFSPLMTYNNLRLLLETTVLRGTTDDDSV